MRPETEAAIRAAKLAQGIADARTGADHITSKGGIDLVTGTDVACEDRIREELLRAYPDYPVIGEERGGAPVPEKPYWLVDPICGTRMFASNLPLYCTNIALVENGDVTVAAVGLGKTGEILFAERGKGGWIRTTTGDRPLRVSGDTNALWIDGADVRAAEVVRQAMLSRQWYVWMYSSSIAMAHLADGRLSGLIALAPLAQVTSGTEHFAAGALVASEAGAIVMDLVTGKPWDLQTRSFLAAATEEMREKLEKLVP